ncbi:hypothetical protein PHMEG_00030885 [Phytophthora megakarya]|uniref:SWIM-type domain-containing protein n=1 Tax=Phytophthora megakarya TaxID=4795 RepID=A0A225V0M5_9STRA|nr:hypothetical protein PHMEG_00030885 [Phytophthora megakarya]
MLVLDVALMLSLDLGRRAPAGLSATTGSVLSLMDLVLMLDVTVDPWDLWFITASNNAGIVPNQNPIEAHHSSIKKVAAGHLRVAISHVLAATLPKILIDCGRDRSMISIKTFAPGPINEDIYVAAKALCKSKNHYPRHKGKQSTQLTKSNDYYVVNDENLYGVKVTSPNDKIRQVPQSNPSCRGQVRNRFKCDCKMFYQTGWLCCHVLACIHLICGVDFSIMLKGLPARRTSGRPRKKKTCLTREGLSQGEYTVGALTTRPIEKPASVINWNVLETWPTENMDGEIEDRDYSGARYWDMYFKKREEKVTMAVEQLSNTINYSFRMGHHILPKK